ncbi:MAG: hypothetical protein ACREM6_13210 [Vulcanimicrobiaceae bacterium]
MLGALSGTITDEDEIERRYVNPGVDRLAPLRAVMQAIPKAYLADRSGHHDENGRADSQRLGEAAPGARARTPQSRSRVRERRRHRITERFGDAFDSSA